MKETLILILLAVLIVLVIIAIAVLVKVLATLSKVDVLLDDVASKMKSLDKLFEIVDFATEKMSFVSEVAISLLTTGFKKIFGDKKSSSKRKKKLKEEEEIDE